MLVEDSLVPGKVIRSELDLDSLEDDNELVAGNSEDEDEDEEEIDD